jgi:hypothetical protein
MNIIEKIKEVFGRGPIVTREQAARLARLPQDQARKEFCAILYDHCVSRAAAFVTGELKRGDSPYAGMPPSPFFHEILAVTFWLVDKEVAGGKKNLLDELHDHYFRTFTGGESREERHTSLVKKYERYDDTWNEITGHLDEFGLCVVQNVFGSGESPRTRERTFWIIQYADNAVHSFSPLRKVWKHMAGPVDGR